MKLWKQFLYNRYVHFCVYVHMYLHLYPLGQRLETRQDKETYRKETDDMTELLVLRDHSKL